jgi:hypothetical protein
MQAQVTVKSAFLGRPASTSAGKDYLLQMAIPNVYFHVAIAYAIFCHNGVDIGKVDFVGPVNWIDA